MTAQHTPSSRWHEAGEPDPHAGHYDKERAQLMLGSLTDDELANGAFLNYDQRLSVADMLNPKPGQHMPIVWMTAVKERIRWLSRALERAQALSIPVECEACWRTVKDGPCPEGWCDIGKSAALQAGQGDTRCPDCLGSEFPGWKRGIRCKTCDGTATAPEPTHERAAPAPEPVPPKIQAQVPWLMEPGDWEASQPVAAEGVTDTQRLDWLMHRLSGSELRRLGIEKASGGAHWVRIAIDAALSVSAESKKGE